MQKTNKREETLCHNCLTAVPLRLDDYDNNYNGICPKCGLAVCIDKLDWNMRQGIYYEEE